MKVVNNIFDQIISSDNLFDAWNSFKKDKRNKKDVLYFEWRLEEHIFHLHRDLKSRRYRHGPYSSFNINDPKPRSIHKATVRDRILHHAVFATLNPIFEPTFISNSFSCRVGKGTHKGVNMLNHIARAVSRNNSRPCFALKCDVKKFFASVDHQVLLGIICKRIRDKDALWLLEEIIGSFSSDRSTLFERKGLPIGNLTSQLFANVYLNVFDQFVKNDLKVKNFLRYTDDFVIIADNKPYLENLVAPISGFLHTRLRLSLHPNKVSIRTFHQGIDFLGYVVLPHYRLLRTKTKQRIWRKLRQRVSEYRNGTISRKTLEQSLQSYLGVLSHAETQQFSKDLQNQLWFWLSQ